MARPRHSGAAPLTYKTLCILSRVGKRPRRLARVSGASDTGKLSTKGEREKAGNCGRRGIGALTEHTSPVEVDRLRKATSLRLGAPLSMPGRGGSTNSRRRGVERMQEHGWTSHGSCRPHWNRGKSCRSTAVHLLRLRHRVRLRRKTEDAGSLRLDRSRSQRREWPDAKNPPRIAARLLITTRREGMLPESLGTLPSGDRPPAKKPPIPFRKISCPISARLPRPLFTALFCRRHVR